MTFAELSEQVLKRSGGRYHTVSVGIARWGGELRVTWSVYLDSQVFEASEPELVLEALPELPPLELPDHVGSIEF